MPLTCRPTIILICTLCINSISLLAQNLPAMPQEWLDGCLPQTSQQKTVCASGCDYTNSQLQLAIDQAQPGTSLLLASGETYVGPFNLPEKSGEGWILIRTLLPDDQLPPLNTRIDPSYAPVLARLEAKPGLSAITTSPRAHHYAFLGLEIASQGFSWNVVAIGNGETVLDDLPHDILFDRIYLHGHPVSGSRRGIAMNGRRIAVVNSWISDFKEQGADSQALCAWNGTTFKIVNNRLEGAGENILFGGAKTQIPDMLIADIEFRNNHVIKPLSWKEGHPDYEGTHWTIKNLFELKHAVRVWVNGNVFEQNWADAQTGFAILLTPRTEQGTCPWIRVGDVTFDHNILRHSGSGFNLSARDNSFPTIPTTRVRIHDNLIEDIDGITWGGDGRSLQVLSGVTDLTVDHNTFINPSDNSFVNADGPAYPNLGFVYRNNITSHGTYGVHGSGKGVGNSSLTAYFPGAEFTHNVIANGNNTQANPASYPENNFFPGDLSDIGFVAYSNGNNGDYTLQAGSPFTDAGTDSLDIGAAMDSVIFSAESALAGVYPLCEGTTAVTSPEKKVSSLLMLSPNPGPGRVFLSCREGGITLHPDQLTIQDLLGRMVVPASISCSDGGCEISLGGQPPGLYLIRVIAPGISRSVFWFNRGY